ncbi:MAG: AbrB/MazE/SpoVT family DNA-binding domain-containing protein [Chlamydiia bacterium]|nr:AbrB/MazE/SpoVT family DNA-binding domain-containing protein [Chlamydiia bacterium]
MTLIKKLTKQGNSYSLTIDQALIDLLEIDPEAPLELSTNDEKSLIITPLREEAFDKAVEEKLSHFKEKYKTALKQLAE